MQALILCPPLNCTVTDRAQATSVYFAERGGKNMSEQNTLTKTELVELVRVVHAEGMNKLNLTRGCDKQVLTLQCKL